MEIFLTGATGFLGGELLVLLSKNPQVEKIYCLVRAKDVQAALKRLKRVFSLHGDLFYEDKIFPVIGDLLDGNLQERLSSNRSLTDIDTVIHSAADTHFTAAKHLEEINVGGSKKIATWAAGLRCLETFMYVGTATVCGKEITGRIVSEHESPNPEVEHIVKYTYTKMKAEIEIRKIIPEDKLLVVRPSSVMGDSRRQVKPRDFAILWVFIAINELRLIPARKDAWLELLGVDYVAEAIEKLLFVERKHNTYHISSGPSSISSLGQTSKAMSVLDNSGKPPFRFVGRENMERIKGIARLIYRGKEVDDPEYAEYVEYWKKRFGRSSELRIILRCLDDYLKFADQDIIFDNSKLLQDIGINDPVKGHEYLKWNWPFMQEIDVIRYALDS